MLALIITVTALIALTVGVLLGLGAAYLLVEGLFKLYDVLENPSIDRHEDGADESEALLPVYDWDCHTTVTDGVVRVPLRCDALGAERDAELELTLDEARQLGAMLTADADEPEGAAV